MCIILISLLFYLNNFNSFMIEALSYRNQSIDLLCKWTGFYMIGTSVIKELIHFWLVFPFYRSFYRQFQQFCGKGGGVEDLFWR